MHEGDVLPWAQGEKEPFRQRDCCLFVHHISPSRLKAIFGEEKMNNLRNKKERIIREGNKNGSAEIEINRQVP